MSIRVHQLAKELSISSKELISHLKALKVDVKGHMSSLDDETAEIVRSEIAGQLKTEPVSEVKKVAAIKELRPLKVKIPLTVKELSVKLSVKSSELIKRMMGLGIFATINQSLDASTIELVAKEFGYHIERLPTAEESLLEEHIQEEEDIAHLTPRAPVVTFMGHVDHGKTSLLDLIRKTCVTAKEKGGITQHIGAYEVKLDKGKVTFLDTPGHEAFTAMRARGATVTDIVVLVVAADDGVMPQTIEAIDHARAAEVPIVVAINKCDLPNIDVEKVKRQLSQLGFTPEDWGGKTITVNVSAKTGEGIETLLEMLLLEAEMLELKANATKPARGIVIEGKLLKGEGVVATVLIQNGTLRAGDVVICGDYYGRIKAMINDKGQRTKEAYPSDPVGILGLSGVPQAGESFYVVKDERAARELSLQRQNLRREKGLVTRIKVTLEDLHRQIEEGQIKELKIIAKADVQGSIEALLGSLEKLSTKEVSLKVIHSGVGNINESDVMLASASNAVVIGFHVEADARAKAAAEAESIDVRLYDIIYEAVEDIKAAMEGLLEPYIEEIKLGKAEVLQTFKVSKVGIIAGCRVVEGKITRDASCRLLREGEILFEGRISSLKKFKDDAKEVGSGSECGIGLGGRSDIKTADVIETFEVKKRARKLK